MIMILRWLVFALGVMFAAWLIPGISVENFQAALLAAFVIGVINIFVKPILVLITLPVNILTLGIFSFFLNAFLLMLASYFTPGFKIDGFLPAFLGSLVLAFISGIVFQIPDKH